MEILSQLLFGTILPEYCPDFSAYSVSETSDRENERDSIAGFSLLLFGLIKHLARAFGSLGRIDM